MRRMLCHEFGPPQGLVLEETADPRAGAGEVVIEVRAAGVSFVDGLIVAGAYQRKPQLPFTPGLAIAGDVAEVGPDVWGLRQGDRVVGCSLDLLGGYATHRVLPAGAVVALPDAVGYDIGATAVESYATMLFALLRRTTVQPGEWVLVLGAGGGIGLAAIDVARSLAGRVIAAASSDVKRAAAIDAGAEIAVDYEAEDLKGPAREVARGGVDVVVDPVGGRHAEPALRSLAQSGRYLVVGFAGGSIPRLPLNHVLLENRSVIGVDWGAWSRRHPDDNQALMADLFDRVAAGALHPVTPSVYPLDRAAEALSALAKRRAAGKLVLHP